MSSISVFFHIILSFFYKRLYCHNLSWLCTAQSSIHFTFSEFHSKTLHVYPFLGFALFWTSNCSTPSIFSHIHCITTHLVSWFDTSQLSILYPLVMILSLPCLAFTSYCCNLMLSFLYLFPQNVILSKAMIAFSL